MKTLGCRKTTLCYLVLTIFFAILFSTIPLSTIAEDISGINVLKQMSRNFAQIAERTSPAVVGLEVEKTIEQNSPFGGDRFYDPFDDDFSTFSFEDVHHANAPHIAARLAQRLNKRHRVQVLLFQQMDIY